MAADYTLDTEILDGLIAASPERIDQFLRSTSESITNDIKLSFNSSPPGRVYVRGTISHTASQPGYPPNIDTGALIGSMHWEKVGELTYQVMDGVLYGLHLEEGTSTIQPRPFVQPVFAAWRATKFEQHAQMYGLIRP